MQRLFSVVSAFGGWDITPQNSTTTNTNSNYSEHTPLNNASNNIEIISPKSIYGKQRIFSYVMVA